MSKKVLRPRGLAVLLICIGVLFVAQGLRINILEHRIDTMESQLETTAGETEQAFVELVEQPTTEPVTPWIDMDDVELIGRTIWGEAMGVESKAERAAVAWCILNRVDALGLTVEEVVTASDQFHGYRDEGECPKEHLDLAFDVLTRWKTEKEGMPNSGRVLPAEYVYFVGDGEHNHFTTEYLGDDYWDWSLPDPYKQ